MAAAEQTGAPATVAPRYIGEWFWRFLALIMLASTAWVVWIIYQINPHPLITNAAYEAAASARASQAAKGMISPASSAVPAPAPTGAAPAGVTPVAATGDAAKVPAPDAKETPPEPKVPPVNLEKLKLSESIEMPIPERGKKK